MSDYHSFPTVIPCSTHLQAQPRRSMRLVPLPIRYRGPPVPLPQPQPPYPQASPASPSARGGNWLTFSLHQTAAVPPALTLTSWSLAGKPNVSLTGLNLGAAGPPMTSWHGECPGPTTASTKVRPAKPPGMTRSLFRSLFLDIWGMLPNMTCPQQPRPPCLPISASLCTMPASIPGRVCATTMASYWAWWSKMSSHGPIDPSFRNCAYNTPDSPPPHIPHTTPKPRPHATLHALVINREHVPVMKITLPSMAPGSLTSVPGVIGFVTGPVNTQNRPVTPSADVRQKTAQRSPRNNWRHTSSPRALRWPWWPSLTPQWPWRSVHVFREGGHSTQIHWWFGSPAHALKCPWSCVHALGCPYAPSRDLWSFWLPAAHAGRSPRDCPHIWHTNRGCTPTSTPSTCPPCPDQQHSPGIWTPCPTLSHWFPRHSWFLSPHGVRTLVQRCA